MLVIPNYDAVVAAFKRALTFDIKLVAIELERSETQRFGSVVELVAFTRNPALTIRHLMGTDDPVPARLIGAAEVLAQTASVAGRRKMGDQHGHQRFA